MANALFAFEDPAAGRRAAQRLVEEGFGADAVQVHTRPSTPADELSRNVDEQVSGGLVQNVLDLFQGVMEWGSSPHDAAPYEDTVRRGGIVVAVDATADVERIHAERVMQAQGCTLQTDWRADPQA